MDKRNIVQQVRMVSLSLQIEIPRSYFCSIVFFLHKNNNTEHKTGGVKIYLLPFGGQSKDILASSETKKVLRLGRFSRSTEMKNPPPPSLCSHSLLKPLVESQHHIELLLQPCQRCVHFGAYRVQVHVQPSHQIYELLETEEEYFLIKIFTTNKQKN